MTNASPYWAAVHYLWQQPKSHVTKRQRDVFDVCSCTQLVAVCVRQPGMLKGGGCILRVNWKQTEWVFTCCAASPLTMWGMRGTSPFRRGGGAKSSGSWSVIIIVTYIHGEIHWTALPGKVQRERKWGTGDVSIFQLYTNTHWIHESSNQIRAFPVSVQSNEAGFNHQQKREEWSLLPAMVFHKKIGSIKYGFVCLSVKGHIAHFRKSKPTFKSN